MIFYNEYYDKNYYKISGNETINNFIQEMQLKFDNPFEWIPYSQFSQFIGIKKVGKGDFVALYSAIWKDGPLYYNCNKKEWKREAYKKVALKCLCNLQN